mmetsp:Transcript_40975/g.82471  ORF Transcript_40975/g.82471 Transcript_40975/m.82471 type:complete len:253 (+) Transcript_40975:23-781(+)
MPRLRASKDNRALLVQFAFACTKQTGHPSDFVARSGSYSIFSALAQCCPAAVRTDLDGARDGISDSEGRKELQLAGFKRVRDRRSNAKSLHEDPEGSGLYLFAGVTWRDVDDADDLAHMLEAWGGLCSRFPDFAQACPWAMFLDVVHLSSTHWMPKTAFKNKRRQQALRSLSEGDALSEAPTSVAGSSCPSPFEANAFAATADIWFSAQCITGSDDSVKSQTGAEDELAGEQPVCFDSCGVPWTVDDIFLEV